jgi:CelD/BcsL family acetyltransferase involved in cellulose biosynthesis
MLQIRHYRLHDPNALQRDWLVLQAKADATFFLSWHWIGSWLAVYKPQVIVVEAQRDGVVCGLGLLVRQTDVRHFFMRSAVLRLHQTGQLEQDQIWIEYNGWLTQNHDADNICQHMSSYVCNRLGRWDEFMLGAIAPEQAKTIAMVGNLYWHERWSAPCFGVDLKAIRTQNIDYLSTLSHNTRYQVRRSGRHYQTLGVVTLQRPESTEQALQWFDDIAPLHIKRWGSGPGQSGFANPQFVDFHRHLIERCWAEGDVDLIALYAGDTHVATFYNLVYNNRVYFYLSGIQAVSDNKQKPGLLGHSMCIEHYMNQGYDFYDFMGGNERYKAQLGAWHGHLVQVSLQRRRLKFSLEKLGRMIKRLMRSPVESQGQLHD